MRARHAARYRLFDADDEGKMVPMVQISSTLSQWIIIAGLGFMGSAEVIRTILLIGIILFAVTTLFTIVTPSRGFDASNRALAWLDQSRVTSNIEHSKAKDALKMGRTDLRSIRVGLIAMLVQYIMIYQGRSRD